MLLRRSAAVPIVSAVPIVQSVGFLISKKYHKPRKLSS
jgi:hypothetical protein